MVNPIGNLLKPDKENALSTEKFPKDYKKYLNSEKLLLKKFVPKGANLIDVGCGRGRAIPILAPLVKRYVGIDMDKKLLNEARIIAKDYDNVRILNMDANKLGKRFRPNQFDRSVMLFNTFACVNNPIKILSGVHHVTRDSCFFTVPAKGNLKPRIEYYESLGTQYRVDRQTESIFSDVWGETRAYSKNEIIALCEDSGFLVDKISKLHEFEYCLILKKQS